MVNLEGKTAFQILANQNQLDGNKVCLYLQKSGQPDEAVTYRQLMKTAAGYAKLYEAAGIVPGEVVILILSHGLDLIGAFWGAVLHGAIPSIMPFLTEKLLPERYRHDLYSLVAVTRPAAVVTYPEFEVEVCTAVTQPGSSVRKVLLCSSAIPEQEPDFQNLAGRACSSNDIVFLQHSSGTTGLQKGVAITHQALLNQLDTYARTLYLTENDITVSWLPLYHDMGLIAGFLMPILCGTPLVLMSPFDWVKAPVRLLQAVSKYRGTLSWLPNFAYNFCAQKIRENQLIGIDLSSWRAVINCSEPMFFDSFRLFAERFMPYGFRPQALATSYAMAENVFAVTQGGIESPVTIDEVDMNAIQLERIARPNSPGNRSIKMLSCGKPLDNTIVRVLDEVGNELPERHVGELSVKSNCMLMGYYNRPDETDRAIKGGWYMTGDYGYLANGEVYITGRKKDLIIVGGRNIFPQDIEAVANQVPGVRPGRAVAFGVLNESIGTEDVALVAEVSLPEDQYTDQAYQAIEDAIRLSVNQNTSVSIKHIRLVGPQWLIKTSSGKIARAANRERFLREF